MSPGRRITKEYYFPDNRTLPSNESDTSSTIVKAYKLKRSVNQWLERINYRKDDVKLEDVEYLHYNNNNNNGGDGEEGSRDPQFPDYFLPRINYSFEKECEQGIKNFHIFKITSTDSVTWKTKRQILIRKL